MAAGKFIRRSTAVKSNTEFTTALRARFSAAQEAAQHNGESWTTRENNNIFVPSIDFTQSGLAEERSQYELTVKLFFIPHNPASCRCAQTREAVGLVLQELHVPSIDLLIVTYPGIAFDAEDEDETDGDRSDSSGKSNSDVEDVDSMIETWACLEDLHDKGVIAKLGVSEFGTDRLSKFLAKARVRPSVNQINVRDCCVVPKPLILYAKQEKVELLTHNDCTNILPSGTVRDLLGPGEKGFNLLHDQDQGLRGQIMPQWVIKYTAVVKDRGVVENKGYFALAELQHDH